MIFVLITVMDKSKIKKYCYVKKKLQHHRGKAHKKNLSHKCSLLYCIYSHICIISNIHQYLIFIYLLWFVDIVYMCLYALPPYTLVVAAPNEYTLMFVRNARNNYYYFKITHKCTYMFPICHFIHNIIFLFYVYPWTCV